VLMSRPIKTRGMRNTNPPKNLVGRNPRSIFNQG